MICKLNSSLFWYASYLLAGFSTAMTEGFSKWSYEHINPEIKDNFSLKKLFKIFFLNLEYQVPTFHSSETKGSPNIADRPLRNVFLSPEGWFFCTIQCLVQCSVAMQTIDFCGYGASRWVGGHENSSLLSDDLVKQDLFCQNWNGPCPSFPTNQKANEVFFYIFLL